MNTAVKSDRLGLGLSGTAALAIIAAALLSFSPSQEVADKSDPVGIVADDHKQKVCELFLGEIAMQIRTNDMAQQLSEKELDDEVRLLIVEFDDGPELDLLPDLQARLHSVAKEGGFRIIAGFEEWRKLDGKLGEALKFGHRIDRETLPEVDGRLAFNVALIGGVEYTKSTFAATLKARGIQVVALGTGEIIWSLAGDGVETVFESGITNRLLYLYGGIVLALLFVLFLLIVGRARTRRRVNLANQAMQEEALANRLRKHKNFRNRSADRLAEGRRDLGRARDKLPEDSGLKNSVNELAEAFSEAENSVRNAAASTAASSTSRSPKDIPKVTGLENEIETAVETASAAAQRVREESAVDGTVDGNAVERELTRARRALKDAEGGLANRARLVKER